ncbi:MAG TPA: 2-dehydropantoate 2-reductase [Candidatus Limnocylindrales bacterium]|nr:2-dehydropantoate 2-reductase [Candidatus Limnocylindrales bacterium]
MIRRIAIFGAGAIGSVVGGMLTRAGHDVTLIDQWPAHVEAMKTRGLHLTGVMGDLVVPVRALHVHELQTIAEPFDAVFLAVKSYDTEWATALALPYLREPDGVVVDFQNGINDERVAAVAGKHRTLGCVITISAGMYEPGHAMRTDTADMGFKIGEHDGADTPRARELAEVMGAVAGSAVTTNLWGERWSKLAINCMANPLAGLTGLGTLDVRTIPDIAAVGVHLGAEAIAVGRAVGHEVEPIYGIPTQRYLDAYAGTGLTELLADIATIARARGGGQPSLLQDVIKKRRTEIDYLNGYVAAEGKRVGVKTPFNDAVVATIRGLGVGFKPDPAHLAPVIRMLPGGR